MHLKVKYMCKTMISVNSWEKKTFQVKGTHFKVKRGPVFCYANMEQSAEHFKLDLEKEFMIQLSLLACLNEV